MISKLFLPICKTYQSCQERYISKPRWEQWTSSTFSVNKDFIFWSIPDPVGADCIVGITWALLSAAVPGWERSLSTFYLIDRKHFFLLFFFGVIAFVIYCHGLNEWRAMFSSQEFHVIFLTRDRIWPCGVLFNCCFWHAVFVLYE